MNTDGAPIDYPEEAREHDAGEGAAPTKALADLVEALRRIPEPKLFGILGFIGFMVLEWAGGGKLSVDVLVLYFVFLLGIGVYMLLLSTTTVFFKAIAAQKLFIVRNIGLLLIMVLAGLLVGLYWTDIALFLRNLPKV